MKYRYRILKSIFPGKPRYKAYFVTENEKLSATAIAKSSTRLGCHLKVRQYVKTLKKR